MEVVLVKVIVELANNKVVDRCQNPGSTNGIICTDVRHNRDLGSEPGIREQKAAEQGSKGTTEEPKSNGVERKFVTAICVLLSASKLIVQSARHSL